MKLGKTLPIDELVALVLKQKGLYSKFKEREVCGLWNEVVGGLVASRTQGVSVRNGVLFVKLASSVVKNAVLMEKEGIIQALNKRVGEDVVKDILVS